jgi:N-acyl-D-aspartate/D-glutamate deacylase
MASSSPLSLAIRNARIVDGSGGPAYRGDVGVSGDRIVAVGRIDGTAAHEIDAQGHVVAPGFIDIHTHYDPQLCWDKLATPTPEHGVTTLIMGNCSVTLAPVKPEHRHRLIQIFGSVEDMDSSLLESTIPFAWESFPEYLGQLRRELGPNVGVFVGHAILRLFVMGAAAQERQATDAEVELMCAALREAIRAGAFGISFTFVHLDEQGQKLPCAYADRREKLALLRVLAAEGRGIVEVAPSLIAGTDVALGCIDEFGELALETGVTCSLSPILQSPLLGDLWLRMLERFEHWQQRGAPIFAQTQARPLDMTVVLSQGSAILAKGMQWRRVFELPAARRIEALRDPAVRAALGPETDGHSRVAALTVKHVHAAANQRYLGRSLADIAKSEGKSLLNTMLDIALADELETEFALTGVVHADAQHVGRLLDHPGVHIGSGDAGAHINQFCGAGDTCYVFEKFVRAEKLMSVERAVQRLTSDLAQGWGIKDRGELAPGKYADLVVFDPDTIARGEEELIHDVPGGSGRYVRRPSGVHQVIVNGAVLVDEGRYTSARPGRLV